MAERYFVKDQAGKGVPLITCGEAPSDYDYEITGDQNLIDNLEFLKIENDAVVVDTAAKSAEQTAQAGGTYNTNPI